MRKTKKGCTEAQRTYSDAELNGYTKCPLQASQTPCNGAVALKKDRLSSPDEKSTPFGALACLVGCAGAGATFAFLVVAHGMTGAVPPPLLIASALVGPGLGAFLGLKRSRQVSPRQVLLAGGIFSACLAFVCLLGYAESRRLANLGVVLLSAVHAVSPYLVFQLVSPRTPRSEVSN